MELCMGTESEGPECTRVDFQGSQSVWIRQGRDTIHLEGRLTPIIKAQVIRYTSSRFSGSVSLDGLE